MMSLFFKNVKATAAADNAAVAQGADALRDRMNRMLREKKAAAFMQPPSAFSVQPALKKPVERPKVFAFYI